MLQPKCRQPYVHNDRNVESGMLDAKLASPPRPPLPKASQSSSTIDKDLAKQQQLSDWYYIKTGPKSPLPTPRSENRNCTTSSTNQAAVNRATVNISNDNNTIETHYLKCGNLSREPPKNILRKCAENDNSRFHDNVQIAKLNGNDNRNAIDNVYQAVNTPSSCGNIKKMYTPLSHQYSADEPLCKFNLRNNSEKVNECSKWQQPQDLQQRIRLMSPSSPSITAKNVHQQQSQPFHHFEPSQKHLSSPQQPKHRKQSVDFQQKSDELQREQVQDATNLQSHNERMNSDATMTSHSNSNVQKSQHTNRCGNANSSSFQHVNVTSGFSSLSASSEMTIDDKRRFNSQNYAVEQCFHKQNNVGGESQQCLQQTVSSSPSLPIAHQSKKVSGNYGFCCGRKLQTVG